MNDPTLPKSDVSTRAKALYNMLMKDIEPDLTTDQIPLLVMKYKDEAPSDFQKRKERYKRAGIEYRKQYQAYVHNRSQTVRAVRSGAMTAAEHANDITESIKLTGLEGMFSTI